MDPMFTAVLFTTANLKAAKVPISRGVDKKAVVRLHSRIPLGCRKGNVNFCDIMDGPGEYCTK